MIARRELATMILHNISLRIKLIRQLLAVDEKLKYNSGCSDVSLFVNCNGLQVFYLWIALAGFRPF